MFFCLHIFCYFTVFKEILPIVRLWWTLSSNQILFSCPPPPKKRNAPHTNLYTPINRLPQDGGVGQPRGIRLCKAHVGWDFDIHNDPRGGKFDSTAILKSWEDLGMSDEWCAILENTQNTFEWVSRVQGWLNESTVHWEKYCVVFFTQKCCFLCPSVLCL